MIPSSTIDFDVVLTLDKMVEVQRREEFVLIHLSRQIELDEPREVVKAPPPPKYVRQCILEYVDRKKGTFFLKLTS